VHHPADVGEAALDGLGVVAQGPDLVEGPTGQVGQQVGGEQLVEVRGHTVERTPPTPVSR